MKIVGTLYAIRTHELGHYELTKYVDVRITPEYNQYLEIKRICYLTSSPYAKIKEGPYREFQGERKYEYYEPLGIMSLDQQELIDLALNMHAVQQKQLILKETNKSLHEDISDATS